MAIGHTLRERVAVPILANFLVRCSAGISRSTAAAYVILNALLDQGREAECMDAVHRARSVACPHYRVVELGDELLDRRGAMTAALRAHILND